MNRPQSATELAYRLENPAELPAPVRKALGRLAQEGVPAEALEGTLRRYAPFLRSGLCRDPYRFLRNRLDLDRPNDFASVASIAGAMPKKAPAEAPILHETPAPRAESDVTQAAEPGPQEQAPQDPAGGACELPALGELLKLARANGARCSLRPGELFILGTVDRVLIRRQGWGPADRDAKTRAALRISTHRIAATRARGMRRKDPSASGPSVRSVQRDLRRLLDCGLLAEAGRSPRGAPLVFAPWVRSTVAETVQALGRAMDLLARIHPLRAESAPEVSGMVSREVSPNLSPMVSPWNSAQSQAPPEVKPCSPAEGLKGPQEEKEKDRGGQGPPSEARAPLNGSISGESRTPKDKPKRTRQWVEVTGDREIDGEIDRECRAIYKLTTGDAYAALSPDDRCIAPRLQAEAKHYKATASEILKIATEAREIIERGDMHKTPRALVSHLFREQFAEVEAQKAADAAEVACRRREREQQIRRRDDAAKEAAENAHTDRARQWVAENGPDAEPPPELADAVATKRKADAARTECRRTLRS
ncbi:MAG: hypothetical protein KAY32_10520 [Candidatus Eisenbacteria sp.]|nr:hypothetical protein [Candidatus Eisenbacteria bacterium]